jgi:hypothetical protein
MTRTKKQVYRTRVKNSPCRGKTFTTCRRRIGCKLTKSNKRKSYCRRLQNRSA